MDTVLGFDYGNSEREHCAVKVAELVLSVSGWWWIKNTLIHTIFLISLQMVHIY